MVELPNALREIADSIENGNLGGHDGKGGHSWGYGSTDEIDLSAKVRKGWEEENNKHDWSEVRTYEN